MIDDGISDWCEAECPLERAEAWVVRRGS